MGIGITALSPKDKGFIINANSAGLNGFKNTESILAAQGAGTNIYITQVSISSVTAQTVTIGSGETGDAVTTPLIGPITFTTSGKQYHKKFLVPLKVDTNTALTVDSFDEEYVNVFIAGFIK